MFRRNKDQANQNNISLDLFDKKFTYDMSNDTFWNTDVKNYFSISRAVITSIELCYDCGVLLLNKNCSFSFIEDVVYSNKHNLELVIHSKIGYKRFVLDLKNVPKYEILFGLQFLKKIINK